MLSTVTVQDVADQMGVQLSSLDSAQQSRIESAIAMVESLIEDRFPEGNYDFGRFKRVVQWVTAEWYQRPTAGQLSTEVAVDDARTATRWDGRGASLSDILESWWEYLQPTERRRRGAFTIAPAYQPDQGGRCGRAW